MGAKIQCTSCYTAYHPLCARLAGLHMEILDGGDSGEEVPVSPACPNCPDHLWPLLKHEILLPRRTVALLCSPAEVALDLVAEEGISPRRQSIQNDPMIQTSMAVQRSSW